MLILNDTDKVLQMKLADAGEIPFTTHWSDITSTTFVPGSEDGYSNGTSVVDIVSSPEASTQRQVKAITLYNSTGSSATITVRLKNGSAVYNMVVVTLSVGEMLQYTDTEGWKAIKTDGSLKIG